MSVMCSRCLMYSCVECARSALELMFRSKHVYVQCRRHRPMTSHRLGLSESTPYPRLALVVSHMVQEAGQGGEVPAVACMLLSRAAATMPQPSLSNSSTLIATTSTRTYCHVRKSIILLLPSKTFRVQLRPCMLGCHKCPSTTIGRCRSSTIMQISSSPRTSTFLEDGEESLEPQMKPGQHHARQGRKTGCETSHPKQRQTV